MITMDRITGRRTPLPKWPTRGTHAPSAVPPTKWREKKLLSSDLIRDFTTSKLFQVQFHDFHTQNKKVTSKETGDDFHDPSKPTLLAPRLRSLLPGSRRFVDFRRRVEIRVSALTSGFVKNKCLGGSAPTSPIDSEWLEQSVFSDILERNNDYSDTSDGTLRSLR